jgi:hypothetical protein
LPETINITLQSVSQVGENGQIELHPFSSSDPSPFWVHFDTPVFTAIVGMKIDKLKWEKSIATIRAGIINFSLMPCTQISTSSSGDSSTT